MTLSRPATVLFICHRCYCPVRAALSMIGRRSTCPFCDQPLLVPASTDRVQDGPLDWSELPVIVITK